MEITVFVDDENILFAVTLIADLLAHAIFIGRLGGIVGVIVAADGDDRVILFGHGRGQSNTGRGDLIAGNARAQLGGVLDGDIGNAPDNAVLLAGFKLYGDGIIAVAILGKAGGIGRHAGGKIDGQRVGDFLALGIGYGQEAPGVVHPFVHIIAQHCAGGNKHGRGEDHQRQQRAQKDAGVLFHVFFLRMISSCRCRYNPK